jgi:hypothetical protein
MSESILVATGWVVVPDYVTDIDRAFVFHVLRSPSRQATAPLFYWRGPNGKLLRAGAGAGLEYFLPLDAGGGSDTFPLRPAPNPYTGYPAPPDPGLVALHPAGAELLLLDAACLLDFRPNGSLASDAEQTWVGMSAVPLAALARHRPMAYVVRSPLADYDAARRLLRRAPAAPVLAAGTRWDVPAYPEAVLNVATRARRYFSREPLLVTQDAKLARQLVADKAPAKVILVGEHPSLPRPGVNVSDWQTLVDMLGKS